MTDQINPQSKRFYEILDDIRELHDKKRHDYGANEDIFANFRLSELSGIKAWQGSVVRMGDKYARMSNFIKKGEFKYKEESIKDTLMDMAIYSLITLILFEEQEADQRILDDAVRDCPNGNDDVLPILSSVEKKPETPPAEPPFIPRDPDFGDFPSGDTMFGYEQADSQLWKHSQEPPGTITASLDVNPLDKLNEPMPVPGLKGVKQWSETDDRYEWIDDFGDISALEDEIKASTPPKVNRNQPGGRPWRQNPESD